ncbi:MAG TPA: hypothetical protein VJ990_02180 [Clostridia bacterium]|nr:hypothetical protein [Clostridia bacterium]
MDQRRTTLEEKRPIKTMTNPCMKNSKEGKSRSKMTADIEMTLQSFPPKAFVNLGSRKTPAENENRNRVESKRALL